MKKVIICLVIIIIAVGVFFGVKYLKNDTSTQTSETTDSETIDENDIDALAKMEVEKGLFDVQITVPKEYVGDKTQEELTQTAKENGYKEITLNPDGSATYVMTKSQHKKMMKELKESFDQSLKEIIESEDYPNFVDVQANDDFTEITITTTKDSLDLGESFSTVGFYMYGGMYAIFNGTTVDNVHVKYVQQGTGKIVHEGNSSDWKTDN